MLVDFAIDPLAIESDDLGNADHSASRRALIDIWRRIGILVYGATSVADDLLGTIEKLPPQLRKEWQVALKGNRRKRVDGAWNPILALEDIEQVETDCGLARCICVEDTRADMLGVASGDISTLSPHGSIEIARFHAAYQAHTFSEALAMASRKIWADDGHGHNTSTDAVWHERLEPLAQNSGQIVLVDRYAYKELLEPGENSGLERFLRRLARVGRCSATVYAAFHDDHKGTIKLRDYRNRLQELIRNIIGGGIQKAQFFICEDKWFRDYAHHRYARFDENVLKLDTGISVLAGDTVRQSCEVDMTLKSSDHERTENILRRNSYPAEGF